MKRFINKLFATNTKTMNWNQITSEQDLNELKELSNTQRVFIFKHSTRCSISSVTLDRLEREWDDAEITGLKPYFLDLITYRSLSNQVADDFGIMHESPQVLVIDKGACIYHTSHLGINYSDLKKYASVSAT